MTNTSDEAFSQFTKRAIRVLEERAAAIEEAKLALADLKTECKLSFDQHGVDWSRVAKAARSRVAKKTVEEKLQELQLVQADLELLGLDVLG